MAATRAQVADPAPPPARGAFSAWLWGVRGAHGAEAKPLHPQAKLGPLLASLPPVDMRPPLKLQPLGELQLRAFDLAPVAPPPAVAASQADGGAAQLAGAPPAPQPPVDLRLRIWQLAHIVHETYTNHWPHTWPRPPFAIDQSNPQPGEWKGYAEQLVGSTGVKGMLESWRNAPETAPKTREALTELMEKLKTLVSKLRKKKKEEEEERAQAEASKRVADDASLAEQERHLETQALNNKHRMLMTSVQRRIEELQRGRKTPETGVQLQEAMGELTDLQQRCLREVQELRVRHAQQQQLQPQSQPTQQAAAAMSDHAHLALEGSKAKRARRH